MATSKKVNKMIVTEEQLQNIRDKFTESEDLEAMRNRALKLVETFGKVNKLVGLYNEKAESLEMQRNLLIEMIRNFVDILKELQISLENNGVYFPSELKKIIASAEEIL